MTAYYWNNKNQMGFLSKIFGGGNDEAAEAATPAPDMGNAAAPATEAPASAPEAEAAPAAAPEAAEPAAEASAQVGYGNEESTEEEEKPAA